MAGLFGSLRNQVGQRSLEMGADRDRIGDVAPFAAAALIAWWTTVRPAALGADATWWTRGAGLAALLGVALVVVEIVRGARRLVATILATFVLPCAVTWAVGRDNATALSEPIEIFVGAVAWAAIGVVLMRPRAVAAPIGAAGGGGPTIGAADDVARVVAREVEADLSRGEPQARLLARHPLPRFASIALLAGALLVGAIGLLLARVGSNEPERAILARMVAAGVAIALLSTAGDLVEVRYLARQPVKPRRRLQRAMIPLALLALLAFVGFLLLGRGE